MECLQRQLDTAYYGVQGGSIFKTKSVTDHSNESYGAVLSACLLRYTRWF